MKTRTLSCRFLPATLFLLGASLRAQMMDDVPAGPPPEMEAGPQIPGDTAVSQPPKPKLSPKEQELLRRFDTNHDGKLDDAELAAAHEAMHQEEMGKVVDNAKKLYSRLLAKFDPDHQGALNAAEQAEALAFIQTNNPALYQKLLQRFDKDHDGKIDPAESQAMFDLLAQAPQIGQAARDLAVGLPRPAAPSPATAAGRGLLARRIYERLLANFDRDHKGSLSPDEQEYALAYLKEYNPRIYEAMTSRFDWNHDGRLSPLESQALFTMLAALPTSNRPVAAVAPTAPQEKS